MALRAALLSSNLPEFCELASLKQRKILYGSFCGAQQGAMGGKPESAFSIMRFPSQLKEPFLFLLHNGGER
ncbi:MAG: hypothetical protein ACYC9M_10000 [Desulfobulbaceae bacterium]